MRALVLWIGFILLMGGFISLYILPFLVHWWDIIWNIVMIVVGFILLLGIILYERYEEWKWFRKKFRRKEVRP